MDKEFNTLASSGEDNNWWLQGFPVEGVMKHPVPEMAEQFMTLQTQDSVDDVRVVS